MEQEKTNSSSKGERLTRGQKMLRLGIVFLFFFALGTILLRLNLDKLGGISIFLGMVVGAKFLDLNRAANPEELETKVQQLSDKISTVTKDKIANLRFRRGVSLLMLYKAIVKEDYSQPDFSPLLSAIGNR